MFLYCFLFIMLAAISILSHRKSVRDQRVFTIISAIIIVCFQGFRWRTGTDWDPYLDCFLKPDDYKSDYEFGYILFNKIIRYLTDSYTVFLFVQCSIVAFCQIRVARFFGVENGSLILFTGFVSTLFPIRFTLAVAIFTLSYIYIVRREIVKFLLCLTISVSLHQMVVVALPFYFFTYRFYSNRFLFIVYFTSCLLGLLGEFVFSHLFDALNLVFNYLPEYAQYKTNAYFIENEEERSLISIIISYVNGAVFIYLFTRIRDAFFPSNEKFNVLLNLYVFGLCFGRAIIGAIPYLARTIACFSGGFIIMLILAVNSMKLRDKRNTLFLQYFLLIALIIYEFIIYYGHLVFYKPVFVPYYSIFSETTRPVIF